MSNNNNNDNDISKLRFLVYFMSYSLIFGIFFICYILYQENQHFILSNSAKLTEQTATQCKHYNLKLKDDQAISVLESNSTLSFLGTINNNQQNIYKAKGCDGELEIIGKIVYE
jgi:hypothetical protein